MKRRSNKQYAKHSEGRSQGRERSTKEKYEWEQRRNKSKDEIECLVLRKNLLDRGYRTKSTMQLITNNEVAKELANQLNPQLNKMLRSGYPQDVKCALTQYKNVLGEYALHSYIIEGEIDFGTLITNFPNQAEKILRNMGKYLIEGNASHRKKYH